MCLGVPQKVIEINNKKAIVLSGDHRHEIDISLISENLKKGDYLLAASDLAINKIEKSEAKKIFKLLGR